MSKMMLSAEATTVGHPDRVADAISDAIFNAYYVQDKDAHVACECMVTTNSVMLAGEIKSTATVDVDAVVRETIKRIGYVDMSEGYGFDANTVHICNHLHEQSADIDMGVTKANPEEQGAGDQGLMIGFATKNGRHYMPEELMLARALCDRLTQERESGNTDLLLPDGKAQVVLCYDIPDVAEGTGECESCAINPDELEATVTVDTVIVSANHEDRPIEVVRNYILENIIKPVLKEFGYSTSEVQHLYINPTGKFVIGGPAGDTGLTGRKLAVENYSIAAPLGGGATAGKDLTKVDRSAAYFARYIAKNIVAAGLADVCQVELSYAIGVAAPTSIRVDTFGSAVCDEDDIEKAVAEIFDARPYAIKSWLDAQNVDWNKVRWTLAYGNDEYPWEQLDKVDELKEALLA